MKGPRPLLQNSVGAKLTDDDFHAVTDAVFKAGYRKQAEWVREVIISATRTTQPDPIELLRVEVLASRAEVLALRRIVLNVFTWSVSGQAITPESLTALIAESDAKKMDLARARFEG